MRDFFVFTMITKTRPWRHIYHDIEIPRPKSHDIERDPKAKKPRHRETEASWFQDIFSEDKKPRHRDPKAEKTRHQDSKTKKPRHRVSAEFWPLCPLILFPGCQCLVRCVLVSPFLNFSPKFISSTLYRVLWAVVLSATRCLFRTVPRS